MAVITFDLDNDNICVLVEKTDLIRTKEGDVTQISKGEKFLSGKIFANGENEICMVRGER